MNFKCASGRQVVASFTVVELPRLKRMHPGILPGLLLRVPERRGLVRCDVAEHNANTQTANKVEGPLFPTAVRSLAAAATRYRPVLNSELPKTADERDKGMILNAIELCDSILESVVNLPPEVITDKKKGKSKT